MLADFGGDDRIAIAGQRAETLDALLRHDEIAAALGIGKAVARFPAENAGLPLGQIASLPAAPSLHQLLEDMRAIAHDSEIHWHDLVDARAVDIDVNLLGLRSEGVEPPRHAIVEAGSYRNDQIGAVHGHIRFVGAMHAQHAEPVGMIGGKRAEAHQRTRHRGSGCRLQLAQQFACLGSGIDNAAAGIEHGTLCRREHFDSFGDLVRRADHAWLVAVRGQGGIVLLIPPRRRDLHILGDIDHHRTGAARSGDAESFLDRRAKAFGVFYEVVVLGAVAGQSDGIGFLKGVGADERGGDLPGDHHHGNRIHIGIGDAGDRIGSPRAAGHQYHAGLPGRAGIAFGGVRRACFVAHQDMADILIGKELVVDRQHRAAGIAEDEFDTLPFEAFDQDSGAAALFVHFTLRPVSRCSRDTNRPGAGVYSAGPTLL